MAQQARNDIGQRVFELLWQEVFTEYTPVACITNTTVFSQAQITYVLVAQGRHGSSRIVSSLCVKKESVTWSAMSSPCWSLPHFLSSSPPQHEAPLGQHDLLQDDTVHRAPLPEPIQSTSSANEPLSHVNYESGGNLRNTSPTGYEPKELATILWKTSINFSMYRENLENKINKVQLLKK